MPHSIVQRVTLYIVTWMRTSTITVASPQGLFVLLVLSVVRLRRNEHFVMRREDENDMTKIYIFTVYIDPITTTTTINLASLVVCMCMNVNPTAL